MLKKIRIDVRRAVISLIIALSYSFAIYEGNKLQYGRTVNFALIMLIIVLGFSIIYFCYGYLDKIKIKHEFTIKQNIRCLVLTFVLIIIMWMPSFIAAFPGVFSYDAPHQLWQFASPNGIIANNQPIVSSLLLYLIMKTGYLLFGRTWEAGLILYLIIQIVLFALTFSYISVKYIKNKSLALYIIMLLIIGFYPANQLFVINAAKDVMYSLFFLWFVMVFVDIMKAIYEDRKISMKQYVFFGVIALLLLFWRNNSVYALILTIPFMFLLIKGHKKVIKLIMVSAGVILVYMFVTKCVYKWMGFGSSSIVESLAIPEQQLAYTYIESKDTLTDEQIEFIENLMPEGFESNYLSTNSDFIRPQLSVEYINSIGFKNFIKYWFQIGVNHKRLYIDAFLNNTRGYWYPYYQFSRLGSDRYIEYENSQYATGIITQRYMMNTKLSDFYYNLSDKYIVGNYKCISWFTSIAFSFWMTIVVTGYALYKRKKELMLVYIFIWWIWLTLFAGPLALMRYAYPFTITIPFLLFENKEDVRECN